VARGPVSELAEAADEFAQLADQACPLLDDRPSVGLEFANAPLGGLAKLACLTLRGLADFARLFGGRLAHLAGLVGGVLSQLPGFLLGRVVQLLRLLRGALDPIIGLGARAASYFVRCLVGVLEKAFRLVGNLLEGGSDCGFGAAVICSSASTWLTRVTYSSAASRS
jgi:hypothetical protein